jgi:serine/threonine-protein kinase
MSPEQASGSSEADARSDVYAIGVIFYEAVTGHVPFDAPTFNQLLFKIVLSEPPLPRSSVPDLDPAFESIILKAMARDIGQRFQSAEEFSRALEVWEQTGTGVSIPPPAMIDGLLPGARAAMASSPELRASSFRTGSKVGVGIGSDPGVGGAPGHWSASQPGGQAAVVPGAAIGPATGGNWATSQPDVGPPGLGAQFPSIPGRKSGLPMLLAAAATLIVVVALGVVIAARAGGSDEETPTVDPAASSASLEATAPATTGASIPPPPIVEPLAASAAKPPAASAVAVKPPPEKAKPLPPTRPPSGKPPPKRPGKKQQDDFGY